MVVVFLLAAVQAFFLMSLLLAKQDESPPDKILMVWLAGIGLGLMVVTGFLGREDVLPGFQCGVGEIFA